MTPIDMRFAQALQRILGIGRRKAVETCSRHAAPVRLARRLHNLITAGGLQLRVADAMERDVQIVGPHDMLDAVLGRLDARPSPTAPFVQDGRLMSLLTADAVAEFLSIQAALDHAPA